MYKLFLSGLVFALACTVQAASITWGSYGPMGKVESSPAGGNLGDYVAYLCTGDSASATETLSALQNGSWTAPLIGENNTAVSKNVSSTGIVNTSTSSALNDDFVRGETYSFYVVIIDAEGQYAMVSSVLEGTLYQVGTTDQMTFVQWSAEQFYGTSGGWQQIGGGEVDPNVPEPTALALLALGVAGVALRRRVA